MCCQPKISLSALGTLLLLLPTLSLADKIAYSELKQGDTITVPLDLLLPTQAVLDYDAEYANLQRYAENTKQIYNDLCRLNGAKGVKKWNDKSTPTDPKSYTCLAKAGKHTDALSSVVIAPEENTLYLTSNLTILSSFWDMPNGGTSVPVMVKVSHNLSNSGDDFWTEMKNNRDVWLVNAKGEDIESDDLPEYIGLKQLKADKYLSLVHLLNGISYAPPTTKDNEHAPIPQFALNWALELRTRMKIKDYNLNDTEEYATALTEAATIMTDLPDDEIIGNSDLSAKAMGQLDQVNSKKLEKLLTTKNSPFGLAMAYRIAKKEKTTPKALLDNDKASDKVEDKKEANEKQKEKQKDQPNAINESLKPE
ncbi:ParB/Srx family N-terminal domain-containing protein [Photobacterium nomapromontoriensis]|uniref:ParB/Srx family N-terminal domain-containing protein n=1 Tax=Photobacterium nomapromontoriensis TaxID=2910237 RepID=UPI003D0B4353